MSVFSEWKASRDRRRRASAYLDRLSPHGGSADTEWLVRGGSTASVASRELRFMQRAMALIVSERDALDDRTASDVAHCLAREVERETADNPEVGRMWIERWREYTTALATRGSAAAPMERLGRVLLAGAGVSAADAALLSAAAHVLQVARNAANESLRAAFGVASLPDDVRPSAMQN